MSLYTLNKTTATDINHTHPRLLAAGYWPGRGQAVEADALWRLRNAQFDVEDAVADALSAIRSTTWTVATSDTDCDGTSWQAHRVEDALDEDDAIQRFVAQDTYGCYDINSAIPEVEFYDSPAFALLDDWSQNYYRQEGYVTLGNTWS